MLPKPRPRPSCRPYSLGAPVVLRLCGGFSAGSRRGGKSDASPLPGWPHLGPLQGAGTSWQYGAGSGFSRSWGEGEGKRRRGCCGLGVRARGRQRHRKGGTRRVRETEKQSSVQNTEKRVRERRKITRSRGGVGRPLRGRETRTEKRKIGRTGTQTEAEAQEQTAGDWLRPRPRNGGALRWGPDSLCDPGQGPSPLWASFLPALASFDAGRNCNPPLLRPSPPRRETTCPGSLGEGAAHVLPGSSGVGGGVGKEAPPTEPGAPDPSPLLQLHTG